MPSQKTVEGFPSRLAESTAAELQPSRSASLDRRPRHPAPATTIDPANSSGGEQQPPGALARALVKSARILFADEAPPGNLDSAPAEQSSCPSSAENQDTLACPSSMVTPRAPPWPERIFASRHPPSGPMENFSTISPCHTEPTPPA